jgi:hypothetical protein
MAARYMTPAAMSGGAFPGFMWRKDGGDNSETVRPVPPPFVQEQGIVKAHRPIVERAYDTQHKGMNQLPQQSFMAFFKRLKKPSVLVDKTPDAVMCMSQVNADIWKSHEVALKKYGAGGANFWQSRTGDVDVPYMSPTELEILRIKDPLEDKPHELRMLHPMGIIECYNYAGYVPAFAGETKTIAIRPSGLVSSLNYWSKVAIYVGLTLGIKLERSGHNRPLLYTPVIYNYPIQDAQLAKQLAGTAAAAPVVKRIDPDSQDVGYTFAYSAADGISEAWNHRLGNVAQLLNEVNQVTEPFPFHALDSKGSYEESFKKEYTAKGVISLHLQDSQCQ